MARLKASIITPVHNTNIGMLKRLAKSIEVQNVPSNCFEWIVVFHDCEDDYRNEAIACLKSCRIEKLKILELNDNNDSPSSPRNLGIKEAEGSIIFFVDSDDVIDEGLIKNSYSAMNRNRADMCIYKMKRKSDSFRPSIVRQPFPKSALERIPNAEGRDELVLIKDCWDISDYMYGGMMTVTTKAYRRKFIIDNNIEYDNSVVFGEDALFNIVAMKKAERIVLLPRYEGYIYYNNKGSMAHTYEKSESDILDLAASFRKIFDVADDLNMDIDCLKCELLDHFSMVLFCSKKNISDMGMILIKDMLGKDVNNLEPASIEGVYPQFFLGMMAKFPQWSLGE